MENKELDSVMRRIQKLLAIAEDSRANPNEAAAAASMAESVMRKYQIEHRDLVISTMKQTDGMITGDVVVSAKTNGTRIQRVPLWANWISFAVSRLNDCGTQIRTSESGEVCVRFFGFSADVQVASWMYKYLTDVVLQLCSEYKQTEDYARLGRKALSSYRSGVSQGIVYNLNKAIDAKKVEEAEQVGSAGTSLMIIKQQLVAEKWDSVFESGKSKASVSIGDAYVAGIQDGKKVNIKDRILTSGV